jgi:Zn finger protein HypA/HybF involved in hydrogenase expression
MGDIKICPDCKGEGTILEVTEHLIHNEYETVRCEKCKGSGKIYERTYTLQIPWIDKNDEKFHHVDKVILDSIKALRTKLGNE